LHFWTTRIVCAARIFFDDFRRFNISNCHFPTPYLRSPELSPIWCRAIKKQINKQKSFKNQSPRIVAELGLSEPAVKPNEILVF
jgi:hypothetical protein